MLSKYISWNIGLGVLLLIAGVFVQWFDISAGSLIDWSIGIASFWWLLILVTIPLNIYYDACSTYNE